MLSKGYKRVRSVVCFPTESDQLILCQGIINPTVHSIANRLNHTPDAQSSWYFRPIPSTHDYISENSSLKFNQETEGGIVQYRHMYTINKNWETNDNFTTHPIPSRCDEIQGMPRDLADKYARGTDSFPDLYNLGSTDYPSIDVSVYTEGYPDDSLKKEINDSKDLTNVFVVDWNYLTFHSPEFEFNDSFHNMDAASLRCKIIGKQLLTSNQGDIHITTSTGPMGKDAPGFYHRSVSTSGSAFRINAGLFYKDNRVYSDFEQDSGDKTNYPFLVYPWHRYGSLNNDCVRPYSEDIS